MSTWTQSRNKKDQSKHYMDRLCLDCGWVKNCHSYLWIGRGPDWHLGALQFTGDELVSMDQIYETWNPWRLLQVPILDSKTFWINVSATLNYFSMHNLILCFTYMYYRYSFEKLQYFRIKNIFQSNWIFSTKLSSPLQEQKLKPVHNLVGELHD